MKKNEHQRVGIVTILIVATGFVVTISAILLTRRTGETATPEASQEEVSAMPEQSLPGHLTESDPQPVQDPVSPPPQTAVPVPESERTSDSMISMDTQPADTHPPGYRADDEIDVPEQEIPARDTPPWVADDGTPMAPSAYDAMIRRLADEITTGSGPEAQEHARRMLEASQEGVAVIGAAILSQSPDWDEELYQAAAGHDDPAVPLFALRALRDAGYIDQADELSERVRYRFADLGEWADWTARTALSGTVVRGLMDMAREVEDVEQRTALIEFVARNEAVDYSGRMRALLEFREVLPFEEFRQRVGEELAAASETESPIWRDGVERLAQRLDGPVEVHAGPQIMTPSDVDVMIAREYPARYEDLALRVESLLANDENQIGVGVTERLIDVIKEARQTPLTNEEASALQRLETVADRIEENDVSHLAPPGPPDL